MSCLRIDLVYSYLEGEFPPSEVREFEDHLGSCPKCRQILEDRRSFLEAANTLPTLEVPEDFADRVMERIPGGKSSLFGWLMALVTGLASLFASLLGFYLTTGEDLASLAVRMNRSLWDSLKNGVVLSGKFLKLILLALNLFMNLVLGIVKKLTVLTSIVRPEALALLFVLTLGLTTAFFYGFGKKLFWEKNDDL